MILDKFKLDGKVAVVTGAGRGLGQGAALGFAEAGADLALVDILSTDETAAQVRALGRRVSQVHANLMERAGIQPVVDQVVRELGGIDILLNNAGIIRRAALLEFAEKDWDDVIQLNESASGSGMPTTGVPCLAGTAALGGSGGSICSVVSKGRVSI